MIKSCDVLKKVKKGKTCEKSFIHSNDDITS